MATFFRLTGKRIWRVRRGRRQARRIGGGAVQRFAEIRDLAGRRKRRSAARVWAGFAGGESLQVCTAGVAGEYFVFRGFFAGFSAGRFRRRVWDDSTGAFGVIGGEEEFILPGPPACPPVQLTRPSDRGEPLDLRNELMGTEHNDQRDP